MLIFDENNKTVVLDNIYTPIGTDFFWSLNFDIMDFTLSPLQVLEETICNSVKVRVAGFEFVIPAIWSMLVVSDETQQLDCVEARKLGGREFTALVYGPNYPIAKSVPVIVVDYFMEYNNISPVLNKNQMLCHPIGPSEWINISPSDSYNKYLKNCTVGDIIA